tara:strand:- start:72 stop:2012 length:1941 start_codon:yes stop_codon:yes gene_type:complete
MNTSQHISAKFNASTVVGSTPSVKEPRIIDDFVIWLEQRPEEAGRTTALIRPWFQSDLIAQELTPSPINLRTRVHGYGGDPFSIAYKDNQIFISWIDDENGQLWCQSWLKRSTLGIDKSNYLESFEPPFCLSSKGNYCFAGGLIDLTRNSWFGVMEMNNKDYLVRFALNRKLQKPEIIYKPNDFIGYLSLNNEGNKLAWVEWHKPSLPWESSELWVSHLDELGNIDNPLLVAGTSSKYKKSISVFQPIWLTNGELVVSEDRTGYWNLMISKINSNPKEKPLWNRLWPTKAESAIPQWVMGMSTIAYDNKNLIALICDMGIWNISILSADGSVKRINQPFTNLSGLNVSQEKLVAIASSPLHRSGLLELNLNNGNWKHSTPKDIDILKDEISIPRSFWFKGFQEEKTHSWYYPPTIPSKYPSPLLVKVHSGPTSMATSGLNLEIQFWTSRGWGVVDVNYAGSSGFGRAYRERLKYGWGEVDVVDCVKVTKSLILEGKADEKYIAIEGGSAGGFTALGCLCSTDLFKVASCRYAVSDLISMANSTHRFEEYYLDYLIGTLPKDQQLYLNRSPLQKVKNINCPVILFQGLKDKVVLPSQTETIEQAIRKNNIPVELHSFNNEGHGFKDGKVKIAVLELTEKFFRKHLNI